MLIENGKGAKSEMKGGSLKVFNVKVKYKQFVVYEVFLRSQFVVYEMELSLMRFHCIEVS